MSSASEYPYRVLVAIASYNERENLPTLLDEIFRHVPFAEVLVIDDASPDGTGDYCAERAQLEPRVKVMHRGGKLGLGTAILASFEYATAHGYDYLVGMDADLSHPPEKIVTLLDRATGRDGAGGCDVAIGSRYVAGGGVKGWPLRRRITSALVNRFARWFLWLPIHDASGGFRCYRVSTLSAVLDAGLSSRGYAIFEEVLMRLADRGAKLAEVPYTFVDRSRGHSKLSVGETLKAIAMLCKLAISRLRPSHRRSFGDPR